MDIATIEIETKACNKCNCIKPMDKYRKYTDKENSYSQTCKKCLNELDKKRKMIKRKQKLENSIHKCELCDKEKPLIQFAKLKKFYKRKICLLCYPSFSSNLKNEWCKNESNTNVNYRLKKSLAARLRAVLIKDKDTSTMDYIGCNMQYLREWFEFNFTDEMTWDNYGSFWSIDHVIPVSKFDLTDEIQKKKCWNWSNLVPVSIQYNSSKRQTVDLNQVKNIIEKLEKFKEEGSTTKWFSGDFIFTFTF